MTTKNDDVELSEQDVEDLASMGLGPDGEPLAPDRSLLRIWREVLSNIERLAAEPVSMGVAGKIVAGWPALTFQDTPRYHELYHEYLLDIRALLDAVIEDNPGAIDHEGDDDMKENYELYKELVIGWNLRLDELESAWRAEDEDSHIQYAALVDARGFLFSPMGLAGHLEAKGFELDSQEVIDALKAMRGEVSSE